MLRPAGVSCARTVLPSKTRRATSTRSSTPRRSRTAAISRASAVVAVILTLIAQFAYTSSTLR